MYSSSRSERARPRLLRVAFDVHVRALGSCRSCQTKHSSILCFPIEATRLLQKQLPLATAPFANGRRIFQARSSTPGFFFYNNNDNKNNNKIFFNDI